MKISDKPSIAAFDFDGTLTRHDSLIPFLIFVKGRMGAIKNILLEVPVMIKFLLGLSSRQEVKEALLTRFFKGVSKNELLHQATLYATSTLSEMVTEKGLNRINWHQTQGHRCILISANLETYLSVWGKSVGFNDVIASTLEFKDDKVTGKLIGLNCRGPEKVRRLIELVGPLDQYIIYAYGDSKGDKELLAVADHSFYRTLN